jgi:hypothetical protein
VDLPPGQAAREQLPERHDAVLACRERRDSHICASGRFGTSGVLK